MPYDTAYLSGFVVEHYQVVLLDAAAASPSSRWSDQLRQLCARRSPATPTATSRSLREFSGRTFKHILVPVWLLTYKYGARTFQVLANGYTGKMAGTYPVSPWKVLAAVTFALLILALYLYLNLGQ